MKSQSTAYPRTDWTSEVKTASGGSRGASGAGAGDSRAASNTGLGGMERERMDGGERPGDWITDPNRPSEYAEEERLNAVSNAPRVLNGQETDEIWPNIENHLPNDVIEAPTTMEEVYRGSMKSLLLRNVGNYVVATFLIGTQTTVSWEGILYDVGNDYLAIYQSGRDQYIVSDLYSLKYVEFYDTRRRALCDELLTEQQPSGNSQRM